MTPDFEREFFRILNRTVEPWIAAGVGSPGLFPLGIVLLETRGRRSGADRRVPLVAYLNEAHLVVSTVRGDRSQWWRNLLATPEAVAWILGVRRRFTASVYPAPADHSPAAAYQPVVAALVASLLPWVAGGLRFAVLAPLPEPAT